jgi:hypothetical protein
VWLVIALQVLAGGYLTIWMLTELPNAVNLLSDGALGVWFGLVLLMLVLIVGGMGVGLLYLAYRLWGADRVGRGITYVACLSIAAAILLGSDHSTGLTLAAIGCIAAVVALAFASDAQAFFMSPDAPGGERPSGVVVAQTLIATLVFIVAIEGILYMMVGFAGAGAKYLVVGLLLLALAVGGRRVNAGLSSRDPHARNIASIGLASVVVLILIVGNTTGTGLFLAVGWSLGALAYLWLPQECQVFFAPAELAAPTDTSGPTSQLADGQS